MINLSYFCHMLIDGKDTTKIGTLKKDWRKYFARKDMGVVKKILEWRSSEITLEKCSGCHKKTILKSSWKVWHA